MKVIVTVNNFFWRDTTGTLHTHKIREVVDVPKEVFERNPHKLQSFTAASRMDNPFPHANTAMNRSGATTRKAPGNRPR